MKKLQIFITILRFGLTEKIQITCFPFWLRMYGPRNQSIKIMFRVNIQYNNVQCHTMY